MAAEAFVLDKLKGELLPTLTYLGIHHTLDVLVAAMRIAAEEEKLDDNKIKLLRIAVYFHDAGLLFVYKGHEKTAVKWCSSIFLILGLIQSK